MNQDEKLMKISVQKVLKNKPIKEEYKKEYPDWMRTIIQRAIVLSILWIWFILYSYAKAEEKEELSK